MGGMAAFGKLDDADGRAAASLFVAYPLIAEPTMESTKKRCRKTKRMRGGSTANVAPAITSPVFDGTGVGIALQHGQRPQLAVRQAGISSRPFDAC
jgi:hypothetical protein